MKDPLKTLPLFYVVYATKTLSIRFTTFFKEAYPIPACKIYHYPQCSHRVKMKIFNTKRSSAHQHHLQTWNWFHKLLVCKHKSQHPQRLQEVSLQHLLAWIHIKINGLKDLKKTPQILKAKNHKRHHGNFNTNYAGPRAILAKQFAPKQNSKILPTI